MQVVILCGGRGTRLSEETVLKPKPLVEIDGKPILWHVMNLYSAYGFQDFLLALGYKGELIREYFSNFDQQQSRLHARVSDRDVGMVGTPTARWAVDLVDSGLDTMTGGRLLRLEKKLNPETFMLTYGDGLGSIDIGELVQFHKRHGKIATVTAVRPPARFGGIQCDGEKVVSFREKSQADAGWINGGFFVFEPEVFRYLTDDKTVLERAPLERLATEGQLMAYKHAGFWQCMDTARDRDYLNELAERGLVPWKPAE